MFLGIFLKWPDDKSGHRSRYISLLFFGLSKSSSLCSLYAFFNDRSCCLNKDDDNKDQALECILDIDTKRRNGNDDKVDGCIRKGSKEDTKEFSSSTRHADSSQYNGSDCVHFIALTGRSWCDISNLTSLKERSDTHKKTCDDKYRYLYKCRVDT